MIYYVARQRNDGRWDYTAGGRPVGYCAEYREIDPKIIPISESQQAEYKATAHKHHCDGHATKEDAQNCYKEYMLDHHVRFSKDSSQQRKCKVCGEWTQNFATADYALFTLCDLHSNREEISKLLTVGESWVS